MEEKVKKVMSKNFQISVDTINNETQMINVERWDSITHIGLVMSLEEMFNVKFELEEMVELISYEKIITILKSKI